MNYGTRVGIKLPPCPGAHGNLSACELCRKKETAASVISLMAENQAAGTAITPRVAMRMANWLDGDVLYAKKLVDTPGELGVYLLALAFEALKPTGETS